MITNIAFSNRAGRWFGGGFRAAVSGAMLLSFTTPGLAAERQVLRGHVPAAVARLGLMPAGRLPDTNRLHLAIGLPLRNTNALNKLLQDMYDPASPQFRRYLTPEQFTERFGPTRQDYEAVVQFARSHGLEITATHSNRLLLDVAGQVADIEKAFQVTLRAYPHPREQRVFYAPDVEPSLDLAVPVLHISGLDNYVMPRAMYVKKTPAGNATGVAPAAGSGPSGTYMGNDFRAAYVPGTPLNGSGQVVGLLEFDGYYTNDITAYEGQAGLTNVPLKNVLLDGFDGSPGYDNVEVALDIDMAVCMAPGLSAVVVYEGYLTDSILNRMATDNLAKQLSASWTYGIDAVTEQIFQQFAAQGQSFFNASGDYDAWVGYVYPPCDDPYITIVGGTTLTTTGPGGSWVSETVWNWGNGTGSGGGISTTYPIPTWQQGIDMTANHGSTTFRNMPDVALTADNVFVVADNGQSENVGGTSCATPLWAGFIALVNQQAVASGNSLVGFINPAIYLIGVEPDYASAFHDITTGNNVWYYSSDLFHAVPGYDLCTGWGTPAGTNLIKALAMPEALKITPRTGFSATGRPGGPFDVTSQTFTLTNVGAATLDWTLANTSLWLSASPSGGTLTQGGSATSVTASLNSAAYNLPVGVYAANIRFINLNDVVVQSRQFTLAVINPPAITAQPTNQEVFWGATTTFTVEASGGLPLFYQWQANGNNLTDGGNVAGSATSTLTLDNVSLADVGPYSVIVSNAVGTISSSSAFLKVISSSPIIIVQPTNQTAMFGSQARFTVGAAGNHPLFYQWQSNGTNLTDAGNISGSATTSLTVSNVSSADMGTYSVVVSNALGSVTSTGAVLTVVVVEAGVQLVQNGGFETGSFSSWSQSGNFADCSVSTSFPYVHSGTYGALLGPVGSPSYLSQSLPTVAGQVYLLSLWLDSPDGLGPNEFQVAWNGTVMLDQTNLGAIGWINLQFMVTATGANTLLQLGFQDDQSFLGLDDIQVSPLVSADGPPIIATQPANQEALSGGAATFSVLSAGRLPLLYQWQFDGTNLANATNGTLALSNLTTNQAGFYSVLVSNSLGSATSSNALLTVWGGSVDLITFDDLMYSYDPVPLGYHDLTWSNFYYLNGHTESVEDGPNGYTAGMVSSSNVAYNAYAEPAAITKATPFAFLSAYLTAAWYDDLQVEAKGYAGAVLIYDHTYTLSATAPTLINFNYLGVTAVQFISSGGIPHSGYSYSGEQFAMDNLSLIFPPSPPVITLQPTNEIVPNGGVALFSVVADGSLPLSYSWQRNGTAIAGATNSSYMTNNVQLTDSGSQFSCLVSNTYGTALSSNATLTVVPGVVTGPVFLTGNYLYLPIQTNGVFLAANTGAKYNSAGTGGTSGVDFWEPGTPVYNYIVGVGGANYLNGSAPVVSGFATLTVSNLSSGALQRALINGVVLPGLSFTRDISFANNSKIIRIVDTLQNTGETALNNVVTLDTADPDQDSASYGVYATLNDVVSVNLSNDMVVASGPDTGLSVGFGSDSGLQIPSAAGFNNTSAYSFLTVVEPNGAEADIDINLAQNYGILAAGQSRSVVWYIIFGNSEMEVTNAFATLSLNVAPSITSQPASVTVAVGDNATFTVGATGTAPLSYFWRRNGVFIAGGTNSTYTNNNVQLTDSGSQFSCLVTNANGTATSSNAILVVVPLLLVHNGGFESGNFSFWTMSGNLNPAYGLVTTNSSYVHSGQYGAQLGPAGSLGYLSQTLTTSIGQSYLISLWLNNPNGATPNEFLVAWNGTNLFDQVNVGATGWTNLQFFVTAAGTNTVLEFGLRNDPNYFGLDDIAVYPISVIRTVTLTNGTISFSWSAQAGLLYQLQYTTNLASGNWTSLGSPVTATGATLSATDSITNCPQRFYRVMLSP